MQFDFWLLKRKMNYKTMNIDYIDSSLDYDILDGLNLMILWIIFVFSVIPALTHKINMDSLNE